MKIERGKENGTTDTVGHGTKVAGIIAAREAKGTGFSGLAPDATIIPIQQNDAEGHGNTATLARAITYAATEAKADIINISQDTADAVKPSAAPETSRRRCPRPANVVVVASAGNDGLGGNVKETYPASFEGVLAVASSDRNRARPVRSASAGKVSASVPPSDSRDRAASRRAPRCMVRCSATEAARILGTHPLYGGERAEGGHSHRSDARRGWKGVGGHR
ncbi:hypothetical protein SBADM41S_01206 [Streptomyces badius]